MANENEMWDDNRIQYPRLLAEIRAVIPLETVAEVADSMDISCKEVWELLERAENHWEKIKAAVCPINP